MQSVLTPCDNNTGLTYEDKPPHKTKTRDLQERETKFGNRNKNIFNLRPLKENPAFGRTTVHKVTNYIAIAGQSTNSSTIASQIVKVNGILKECGSEAIAGHTFAGFPPNRRSNFPAAASRLQISLPQPRQGRHVLTAPPSAAGCRRGVRKACLWCVAPSPASIAKLDASQPPATNISKHMDSHDVRFSQPGSHCHNLLSPH